MTRIRLAVFALLAAAYALSVSSSQAQNALRISAPTVQGEPSLDVSQSPAAAVNAPARPMQHGPRTSAQNSPQRPPISIDEGLAGIRLTDDQKAKIEQVRTTSRSHMDLVVRDPKETPDQKQAMIQGLQRLELRDVYLLLTPDQRAEFRKKILAMRSAE